MVKGLHIFRQIGTLRGHSLNYYRLCCNSRILFKHLRNDASEERFKLPPELNDDCAHFLVGGDYHRAEQDDNQNDQHKPFCIFR